MVDALRKLGQPLAAGVTGPGPLLKVRARPAFARQAYAANVLMMVAGFALMGLQITGYFVA